MMFPHLAGIQKALGVGARYPHRYNDGNTIKTLMPYLWPAKDWNIKAASAASNKWLRTHAPDGCVVHSFRHSMRDRLRAVECPKEIIDQIGGWSSSDVGESYGNEFPLDNIEKWLIKIPKY